MDSQQKEDALASATRELVNIKYALDQSAIVAITDQAGIIIHVNDKFCQISKYSRDELLGKTHRIINSNYHSHDFFADMWKSISNGQTWEGEIKNRAKDGSFYWVNTSIVPFLNEKGRPYQYVSIRYDITQRKLAEEQLRIYAERLESSNRELQDFASIAAHDLQEPLRKIQAFGDRLNSELKEQLSDKSKDFLERMLASASRMRRLIDDLLAYSRVTTLAKPFEKVNLNDLLKEVLSDLEVRIEQTHARVDAGELPTLLADPSQIRQLFQNLIANALKFHKPDVSPVIEIQSGHENGWHRITVTDNGIGFDEKYLDRIFVIFQRLHGKSAYEGTGVGLAICKRIVERHGGHITAQSQPGSGAQFIIRIPRGKI